MIRANPHSLNPIRHQITVSPVEHADFWPDRDEWLDVEEQTLIERTRRIAQETIDGET